MKVELEATRLVLSMTFVLGRIGPTLVEELLNK